MVGNIVFLTVKCKLFKAQRNKPSITTNKFILFFRDLVSFTCFGQRCHLQVIQLCTEYVGGNYQYKVL